MGFILFKVAGFLAMPSTALFLALGVGWLLPGRWWAARWLRGGAVVLLLLAGFTPLGQMLALPLEDRFSRPADLPARVDGIVLLGGAERPVVTAARAITTTNEAAERYAQTLALALAYPAARIVKAGGSGLIDPSLPPETLVTRQWFAEAGLPAGRLLLEETSRDTFENAVQTKAVVQPRLGEVWLLVTSAMHMPRSVAVFRAAGFPVVPWPVDHQTTGKVFFYPLEPPSDRLGLVDAAVREWLGLVAYRFRGRTLELLPRPDPL